tara:strand:- start:16830 stop:18980 length:2151 start_codon:yes stop_codon:yes gene_type:complete
MRAARIPITFRHLVTGDTSVTTIPASYARKGAQELLALMRMPAHHWRVVEREPVLDIEPFEGRMTAPIGIIAGVAWPDIIGGGELVWRSIGQHLQTMGYDVHVFIWGRATYGSGRLRPVAEVELKTVLGMEYHYVPEEGMAGYISGWAAQTSPSALWMTLGWDMGLNTQITALKGQAPLICLQQFWMGLEIEPGHIPEVPEVKRGWPPLFEAPDTLVLNSGFAARVFEAATGRAVATMTPPTEDALGTSSRDGAIITIGSGPEKGTDIVRRVADQFPEEEFVIIGDSPGTHAKNCKSLGWTDPRPYYEHAKLMLAPSMVPETYGMAVEEARKWGVPTIVSDNGALADHAEVVLSTGGVEDWVQATARALREPMTISTPTISRRQALQQLEGVMRRADTASSRPLGDEKFPAIGTFSGVDHTSVAYLNSALVAVFGLTDYPGGELPEGITHCLLHSWHEGQSDIFARLRSQGIHPYAVVHSPTAQGEIDGEQAVFEQVLHLGPAHVLIGHAPMAKALGCRWLPVPIQREPIEKFRRGPNPIGDTLHLGMWNLWSPRKNSWTQLLAAQELERISGRKVVVHGPIPATALHTVLAGPVQIREVPYAPQGEYYMHMGSMDLNLQVTHAESFNYTAMESYLLGAPCLVGPGTPAGRFGMESAFVVDDPTDPILIAQRAWALIQDAAQPWFLKRMLEGALELVDYRHRALRDTLQAIERGDT